MKQIIYKRGLYLCGNFDEIIIQLKSLCEQYKTLNDFISDKTKCLM